MPALRTRKRAASPVQDAPDSSDTKSAKQARKGKAQPKAAPASDDENNSANGSKTKKGPAKKGKGKAEVKSEPTSDDENANANAADAAKAAKPAAKKGKSKAKAENGDDDDATDAKASQNAPDETDPGQSTAQFANSKNLVIPVDDACPLPSTYKVYIDSSDGIIYDAALNQTVAGDNANKYYKVQLLTNGNGDFKTWTRWGRVGYTGQSALLGSGSLADAMKNYQKKFKDKSGLSWADRAEDPKPGKYVFVERSYEPDSDDEESKSEEVKVKEEAPEPDCTLDPPIKSLMELIFNQQHLASTMAHLNYDAKKLPLGKLSKATITRGYETLKKLSALLHDPNSAQAEYGMSWTAAVESLSNQYYSYIPHAFGFNRPPVISDHAAVNREVDLMDSLTDMKASDDIFKRSKEAAGKCHPLDSRFEGLGLKEMTPVERTTGEFKNISDYLNKTCGATHGVSYELLDVFRIERELETTRFQESEYASIPSDRRLLWHGSRSTNFGGILSQGLRIAPPEAPVSGYMFGKGIYLADMSSKSANYCCSYLSDGHALLLLCEAELGAPMQELTDASYTAGEEAKRNKMHSTWGKGQTGPSKWKDAKCIHSSLAGVQIPDTKIEPGATNVEGAYLQYNEYICYDVAQVRLRYLLRVKM